MRAAEPASPIRRGALRRLALAGFAWSPAARAADDWLSAPALPDVTLFDHQGQSRRLVSDVIRDRVVLVHFFFTGCGTVCPPQTALLRDLRQRIDAGKPARRPLFVGLSVDPLGDGPEQLRAYLDRFDIDAGLAAGWVWLTGEPTPLGRGLRAFGVADGAPDAHPNLVWLGDAARRRWTRTAALQAPARIADRLAEVAS